MDNNGLFGEMLEKGQSAAVNTVKNVVSDVAGSVKSQITGLPSETDAQSKTQNLGSQQQASSSVQSAVPSENLGQASTDVINNQALENEQTKEMVKDFYSPSSDIAQAITPHQQEAETKQKLAKLRSDLHYQTYYEPLINYKKNHQQEERQAEKVEREEKEEEFKMQELEQKKAKEDQDIATTRAQRAVESNRGASG
jgi:hypothetical protein